MDILKISAGRLTATTGSFVGWWILMPIIYITLPVTEPLFIQIGSIVFCPLTLRLILNDLFKMAEPYELERFNLFKKIISDIKPSSFNSVILFSGIVFVLRAFPLEINMKIIVQMYGALLIIFASRWWLQDIKGYHLPRTIHIKD